MKYIILVLLIAGGAAAYFYKDELKTAVSSPSQKEKQFDKTFEVKQGGFLVTLNLDGSLQPIKQYYIKPLANSRWAFEITHIIENNTNVKKGDIICRFSDEIFQGDLNDYKIELENEYKNLNVAHEELNAQEFNNIADIKNAAVAYRQSREALIRFRDEDSLNQKKNFIKKLDQLDKSVADAEAALKESVNIYNDNQDQNLEKRLEGEVKAKEKSLQQIEEAKDKAFYDLRVFKKYTFNEQILKLEEAVTKTKLGLQNIIIKARSLVVTHQQNINVINKKIEKLKADIKKEEDILSKLELIAPVDGVFTKTAARDSRGRSSGEYRVGTDVRFGQQIGSIPDMSQFQVEIKVPEAYRSFIKLGLPTEIKMKSIPGLKLSGELEHISTIAVHDINWDKNSPKRYPTKITTKDTDPRLTPGMTVNVDIIIDKVEKVLFVPVESVYNKEGDTYVRVENAGVVKEIKVKTGKSSLDYVEIKEGLKEGDSVVLNWESVD